MRSSPAMPGAFSVTLTTPRLVLRPLRLDDAGYILELVNEPSFLEHIGDKGVRDLAGAQDYLRTGPLAMYERAGMGLLLVTLRPAGVPIGMCGLLQREGLPAPDIGFALSSEHHGRGLAHEAAAAVLEWGRAHLRLPRILAVVSRANEPSQRLLAKLGLRQAGTVRLHPDAEAVLLYETASG